MELDRVVEKIRGFDDVQFIILYGSAAERRMTEESDVDLCVGFDGLEEESSQTRFKNFMNTVTELPIIKGLSGADSIHAVSALSISEVDRIVTLDSGIDDGRLEFIIAAEGVE